MDRRSFYVSRRSYVVQTLSTIALVLYSIVWLTRAEQVLHRALATASLVLGLAGCIRLFSPSYRKSPRLVFSDEGLYDRQLGIPTIPWNDIHHTKLVVLYGGTMVALMLHDETVWLGNASPLVRFRRFANRVFGLPPVILDPNGLDASREYVLSELKERIESAHSASVVP